MLRVLAPASLCLASVVAQSNFPPPPHPPANPPTQNKELLGMALFFEEQLSSTSTVACATCHDFRHGGVDPRTTHGVNPGPDNVFGTADDQRGSPGVAWIQTNGTLTPHGVHGFGPRVTTRRAPTVINSGYQPNLMYDGVHQSLEQLIAVPPVNSVEMAHAGRTWSHVVAKLGSVTPLELASNLPTRLQTFVANRTYQQLFQIAYGSPVITQQGVVDAIAVYLRTLNSDQSKFDRVLHGQAALTQLEQQGLALWNAPANGATSCRTCHGDFEQRVLLEGPIVGQMTMTNSGPYGSMFPQRLLFHNVGIRPVAEDPGRQIVTNSANDAGKFRVASLRNVELAAPYFHNGSAQTLVEVIDFYNRGGDFHVNQAAMLTPRNYTDAEKHALVALLRTLTDPRVAAGLYPFDRPTLGSESNRLATPIGTGTPMANGRVLRAAAPFAPVLGEAWFRLALSGATPGAWTFLMFDHAAATGSLPFGVELALSPSFTMFTIGPAQSSAGYATGTMQVPLPLPSNPALSGQELFTQWLVLEPSLAGVFSTSNALRVELQ